MNDDPLGKVGKTLLNRYLVIRFLGCGRIGHVYLAHDQDLDREVAFRITHHKSTKEGPHREAQMLSRFGNDERILTFLGWEVIDGLQAVVTEYCKGGALSGRLKEKSKISCWPLHPVIALDLMSQVCEGLEVIHRLGYVHQAVRPENIFLTEPAPQFGTTKLGDFGTLNGGRGSQTEITFPGSFFYVAPEVYMGEVPTSLSDIYSVGVTLLRIVTGKYLCDPNLSLQECAKAKQRGDLNPIAAFGDVDFRLQKIIGQAMEPSPSRRQSSSAEIREQLISLRIDLSVEQALRFFRQTVDFQQADLSLSDLIVRFPDRLRPYLALAKLCVQVGLGARASRVYQAASRNVADNTELLFEMAQFKQSVESDVRAAVVYMRQALKQDIGQLDSERRLRAETLLKQWVGSLQGSPSA